MRQATFTEAMAVQILAADAHPLRFENFCVDLFSDVEQVEFVKTSRTYDLGRDGRAVSAERVPPFICCSTSCDDPIAKAKADLLRILETVEPRNILFCFTDPRFTEHKANRIEGVVREECPSVEIVRSFGAAQLGQLATKHPRSFERHYACELADLRRALSMKGTAAEDVELTGLRIALTTQLHHDAQRRRRDIVRNLILTTLAQNTALTANRLAKSVGDKLRLPRPVHVGWLQAELNELAANNLIAFSHPSYSITTRGQQELAERTQTGSDSLLRGQQKIKDLIEELTGRAPSDEEFRIVWKVLEEGIVSMFVTHGAMIIDSIASIVERESNFGESEDLRSHIQAISARIVQVAGGRAAGERIMEVAQAIEDMFQERDSAAFEWLADIGEVFLHLCALGLEPNAQEQVVERLTEIELLLDTDMVLSLLSRGEANHHAVGVMVEQWRELGGKLWVTPAVLEEASHHAWISVNDFEAVHSSLDSMSDSESYHLIGNVFVRGFRAEQKAAKRKCTKRQWEHYIAAFRGSHDHDFEKLSELLNDKGIELLDENEEDKGIANTVAETVFRERKDKTHYLSMSQLREKTDRDGRMAAALLRRRMDLQRDRRTAVIISTSTALRIGVRTIGNRLGPPEPVLYTPAVMWMLSLIPGARLNAATLRAVLFDVDFPIKIDPLERRALRILHTSEQYKLHYSRRATLRRSMREEIRNQAALAGTKPGEIRSKLLTPTKESTDLLAGIVAESVDRISRSKSEKEIAALQEKVARLEQQLRDRRSRR